MTPVAPHKSRNTFLRLSSIDRALAIKGYGPEIKQGNRSPTLLDHNTLAQQLR